MNKIMIVGTGNDDHKIEVEKIKSVNIQDVILELVQIYQRLYELNPYQINCGNCEDFAFDVCSIVPNSNAYWGDELINDDDDPDQYSYHCIIENNGRYYDAQHPQGVNDFRSISAFSN